MADRTTNSITTSGVSVFKQSATDNVMTVGMSGTYGTTVFTFQGSMDNGATYFDIAAIDMGTQQAIAGGTSITLTANTNRCFRVPSEGCSDIAMNVASIGSGTLSASGQSNKFSGGVFSQSVITNATLTGNSAITGTEAITSASATAFAVGANGTTNPCFVVDDSTSSVATGIKVKGAAAAAGCAISVVSSTTNEALTIDAKGSGTITIGGTSTGAVVLPTTNITDAKNVVLATTTGTSFGSATTQKLSFYGVTPITQPAASSAVSVTGTTGASTGVSLDTTFTGGGTAAYTIGGLVTKLKALGLLAT